MLVTFRAVSEIIALRVKLYDWHGTKGSLALKTRDGGLKNLLVSVNSPHSPKSFSHTQRQQYILYTYLRVRDAEI